MLVVFCKHNNTTTKIKLSLFTIVLKAGLESYCCNDQGACIGGENELAVTM